MAANLLRCAGDLSLLRHSARNSDEHLAGGHKNPCSIKICNPVSGRLRLVDSRKKKSILVMEASNEPLTRELTDKETRIAEGKGEDALGLDPFEELKERFLSFKKHNCVENQDEYQTLSQGQAPKFMVVSCADSRVCPSSVLGFRPGEAFTVRNIANLVPPLQHGPSETSAALEFAVNSLQVPNILVIGHSRCGGIQALMKMKRDDMSRSFIKDWVSIAKSARLSTEAAAGNATFEEQCRHCEQESINASLLNLLTYPWIAKRVSESMLSLHGGYYDFVNCTFRKWTLVYRDGLEGGSKYGFKDHTLWS